MIRVLKSSSLASIDYDSSRALKVRFQDGSLHTYYGVPLAVVEGLISAKSAGAYFARVIRNNFKSKAGK